MKSGRHSHVLSLLALGVCAIVVLGFARASFAQGGEPPYFAIQGARIVTVSGPVIEKGTVVVSKGLIKAVGTDVRIPPEALVIDGTGLTVYPGLIDAGTNLGLPQPAGGPAVSGGPLGPQGAQPMPQKISMGPEDRPGTTPWNVAANHLDPSDKRIEAWRNAGFTTALSEPKGEIFSGQGSVIDLGGERASAMVVKPRATLDIALDPIGGFCSFPGSLMGVIAYVRQVFIDARWYDRAEAIYQAHPVGIERPPYDRTELVVDRAVKANELVLLPGNEKLEIIRALRLAEEWQLHAAIYGGQQGYDATDAIAAAKIPVLVSLNWPTAPKGADPEAEVTLRELRFRDRAPSTPAAFAKAGVPFAFYSAGLSSPKEIFRNVRKAMAAGLSADDALRAFTISAAEILGVSNWLGSIEPGKIANLVVADGDIFNENTKLKDVFVDGRRYEIHEEAPPEKSAEKKTTSASRSDAGSGSGAGR